MSTRTRPSQLESSLHLNRDGSVACNHLDSAERRCRKRIIRANGMVVCHNNHEIAIRDLVTASLQQPNVRLGHMMTQFEPVDASYRAVVDRVTSLDFLGADPADSLTTYWISHWPRQFCNILTWADRNDPRAARILRDAWLKTLQVVDPLVHNYLTQLRSGLLGRPNGCGFAPAQEKAICAWSRRSGIWQKDPYHYYAWSQIQAKAAESTSHELLRFYRHNVDEAEQQLGGVSVPYYFVRQTPNKSHTYFTIMLDPWWRLADHWLDRPTQVMISYETEGGGHFRFHSGAQSPLFAQVVEEHINECGRRNREQQEIREDITRKRDRGTRLVGDFTASSGKYLDVNIENEPTDTTPMDRLYWVVDNLAKGLIGLADKLKK